MKLLSSLIFFLSYATISLSFSLNSYSLVRNKNAVLKMAHAAPTGTPSSLDDMVTRALEGLGKKKKLSLLGSTGSIGTQTLDIVRERPAQFECVAMAAGANIDLLAQQIVEFKPKIVSVAEQTTQKCSALS